MPPHIRKLCESRQALPSVHNGCGFVGNPDLYGIGIRTGIYAQWLSALLANHCLSHNREDVHSAYFLFSFALAIATVVITANPSGYCVFFIEIYVLLSLFFGGYFSAHLFPTEKLAPRREGYQYSNRWRSGRLVILAFVYGAMILYSCWFWFKGRVIRFQPTPCGSALFVLVKVSGNNLHKAVLFYKAFTVMLVIYYPFGTFFLLRHGHSLSRWLGGMSTRYGPLRSIQRRNRPHGVFSRPMFFISVFWLVLVVCAIELTLLWNSVSGINSMNSVGQFIPFTVGVGGLVQVLWGIARESVSMSITCELKQSRFNLEGGSCIGLLQITVRWARMLITIAQRIQLSKSPPGSQTGVGMETDDDVQEMQSVNQLERATQTLIQTQIAMQEQGGRWQ